MNFFVRPFRFGLRWAFALGLTAWSLTVGLPFRRSRALLDAVVRHFGWERFLGEGIDPRLPTVRIETLFPEPLAARTIFPTEEDGNVSALELAVLNELVRVRRPRRIFEIGTFNGRTTANLALNSPPDAVVYTLDLPPSDRPKTAGRLASGDEQYAAKDVVGHLFAEADFDGREKIRQLFGDSARFDFTPYEGSVDFVFVDGSHHADYVRNDTEVALRLIGTSGGMIVWHDYANPHWPGVTTTLNALADCLEGLRHIDGTTLVLYAEE